MKKILAALVSLLFLLQTGCGVQTEDGPSVSPAAGPYLTYSMNEESFLFRGSVGQVYEPTEDHRELLVRCRVDRVYQVGNRFERGEEMSRPGAEIMLWIDLESDAINDQEAVQLRALLEEADALIVEGLYRDASKSEELPGVTVNRMEGWSVIPIVEGVVAGERMEEILLANGKRSMAYDLDEVWPDVGLYFQNGDSVETVDQAMERFVKEMGSGLRHKILSQGCTPQSDGAGINALADKMPAVLLGLVAAAILYRVFQWAKNRGK